MSDERINSITASNYSIIPNLSNYGTKIRVNLNGISLKQDKITFNHGEIVNICIVYEISKSFNISSYQTLEYCLIGALSFTKNSDIDMYKYSGYSIGFDRKATFSFGNGFGRNVIIFGVDMSSPSYIDNKKKNILSLGTGPRQGLEHTLTAEKLYSINFTENNKKFCLSLHYNGGNSYLFVNSAEIIKFKAKDSEIVATPLCIGNILKDFSVDIMETTGLNGYVYDFSVDYDPIAVDDILDIHKYLIKKNGII